MMVEPGDAELYEQAEDAVQKAVSELLTSRYGNQARASVALARALAFHAGLQVSVAVQQGEIAESECGEQVEMNVGVLRRTAAHRLFSWSWPEFLHQVAERGRRFGVGKPDRP